jgi:hypothetical protein
MPRTELMPSALFSRTKTFAWAAVQQPIMATAVTAINRETRITVGLNTRSLSALRRDP